jgi:hypothetical protein
MGIADGLSSGRPALSVINLRRAATDTPEDLFGHAGDWLWRRIVLGRPDVLAIEKPLPPHRATGVTQFRTSLITLGLYGTLIGIAKAAGTTVVPAHIATWRKHILGRGNLSGDDAKRAMMTLCRQLNWPAVDHNAAEAGGIWLWACGFRRPPP